MNDLLQNFIPALLPAPSFQQFALQNQPSATPASLNPEESILQTEIVEITAEEFGRSIDAAAQAAEDIAALKLPCSCKRKAKDLFTSLMHSKKRWQETGLVPDEEDIKITDPSNHSHSPSTSAKISRKRRTGTRNGKRNGKRPSVKAADLLSKTPANPSNLSSTSPPAVPPPATLPSLSMSQTNKPSLTADAHLQPQTTNTLSKPAKTPLDPVRNNSSPAANRSQPSDLPNPDSSNLPALADLRGADASFPSSQFARPPQDTTANGNPSGGPKSPLFQTPTVAPRRQVHQNPPAHTYSPAPIFQADAIRIQVASIHQMFVGSKPSWAKYQMTWQSLAPLLHNRAQAMHPPAPSPPRAFCLQRTPCSHGVWINTITSLEESFLLPSDGEQWYCPDIIDFPRLSGFGDKEKDCQPGSFIPPFTKTPHPESTLVRGLYWLLHPPQRLHNKWARIIAASVELRANSLFNPPQVNSEDQAAEDHITRGVETLAYLDAVKNSSSSFDPPQESLDPSAPSAQRLHAVNFLHEFRNVIIDVLMAYVIFQTNFLSEAPLMPAQKKANTRANQTDPTDATDSLAPALKAPSEFANIPADATQQLRLYQHKQNFQPFVYFILAGVRGLFITSRDHRIAGISTCMSFIQAIYVIRQHSTTPHTPAEPIWKNLAVYLVQIFAPLFESPNKICRLVQVKVPTRHELAEAITNDFLTHWQVCNPTSPFLLPHTHLRE
ncbi:hypothetical protein PTTG_08619 [Puccinia triticina 1-1 BBBD Race 1]|uniref:Uncharacterized protein n=1 Tax=Puccinia triticina (isolate 1-1 / race 1 (BBBD)) TaxID=630390 RepID=A0A180G7B3_PUCT1|nr:hypothetical protein PTTG_08619 [Puccinia triticina 1-1 BBBD Race 1]